MHKRNKKKILNILLIPDNEASPKSFRIRYSTLKFLVVATGIVVIALLIGIVTYSQVLQGAMETDQVEQENTRLREQLQKVGQLQNELNLLKKYNEKVRNSLQGYVKFADKPDDQSISPGKLLQANLKKVSIFENVPISPPVVGFVSQEYDWPAHSGIDIVAPAGTPIKAAANGVVVFDGWTYEKGFLVILYHDGEYLTSYWHNARNAVSANQRVKQGDVIAYLGNSGESSSGPHLHFEIWRKGQSINPRNFLSDLTVGE
ncbi:peptidoglycan DD-metalloendopeptidase family protein [Candidatus Saccharibacteria bacterium]|nr:peptidoglycan DD-metalloendopeptidase family protein [Candidatus Saccharibacteria bacterium]NIW78278.1 peptidoglycan DD-metalloendopeptidase family protein [Calditrichia bacterium]